MMHLGNKAFLAIPFPHGLNLTNLSYNSYGLISTLRGLGRALRLSTGLGVEGTQLAKDIAELERLGANSQYAHIFSEYPPTAVHVTAFDRKFTMPGSALVAKTAGKAVWVPFQRFSNMLQDKFLNPLETGFRTAALGQEAKAGKTGVEAARNIHAAFGTNPANKVIQASGNLGQPFAKFHLQTVSGSGWRTLVKDPSRITNLVHAQMDMNKQINPGGREYRPTVPGLSFARAAMDPLGYYSTMFGPLFQLGSNYSGLSDAKKGNVAEALSKALGRYIPMGQAGDVLMRLATGEKGEAGESPQSDILSPLTGGYWKRNSVRHRG